MAPGSPDVVHDCSGKLADFNIAATSRAYVGLASILAGFAFTALVVVVNVRLNPSVKGTERFGAASETIGVAFIGLILTSVSYAVMAGGTAPSGRAATEEVIAGAGFGICAVLLIFAIVLILDAAEATTERPLTRVTAGLRTMVAIFLGPLTVMYVWLGTSDYSHVLYGEDRELKALDVVGLALAGLVFACGLALRTRRVSSRRATLTMKEYERAVGRFALFALGLLLASAFAFSLCEGFLPVCETSPLVTMYALLVVLAFWIIVAIWNLTRPLPRVGIHGEAA